MYCCALGFMKVFWHKKQKINLCWPNNLNLTHTVDSSVYCLWPCPSGTENSSYGNMTKCRGRCTFHYRGNTVAGSTSSHLCWCCFPGTEICRPTSSLNPMPLFFSISVICIQTSFLFLTAIYNKNFLI